MRRRAGLLAPQYLHERLTFIEGLRGVAALYVVLGHFCSMVDPDALHGKSIAPPWLQVLMAPFWYGHLAVASFIILSGFCLQISLFNGKDGRIHDLKRFYIRRAWRILPPYYAALVFSIVISLLVTSHQTGAPFDQYVPVTWTNVAAHVFMVHNLSADWMYKLNGVMWSIAIEAQLYLLFPLLVAALFKFGRAFFVLGCLVLSYGIVKVYPEALKLYPWYLALFALGMATAHLAYRPNIKVGTLPGLVGTGCVVGVIACVYGCTARASIPTSDLCIGVAVASLIYVGTVAPWAGFASPFGWKPLAKLGAFSYSLYLMHHPIEQVLFVYRPRFIQGAVGEIVYLLAIGLPIILFATYAFSLVFERPFILSRTKMDPNLRGSSETPVELPLKTVHKNRLSRPQLRSNSPFIIAAPLLDLPTHAVVEDSDTPALT